MKVFLLKYSRISNDSSTFLSNHHLFSPLCIPFPFALRSARLRSPFLLPASTRNISTRAELQNPPQRHFPSLPRKLSSSRKLPPSSLRAGRGRRRFYFSCPVSFAAFLSPGDAGKKLPNAAGATLEREVRKGREFLARNHLRQGKRIVNQRLFSPSCPGERNEELASSLRSARRGR